MDFENGASFERSAFFMTITRNFERFQYFHFQTNFLKNEQLFQKIAVPLSS